MRRLITAKLFFLFGLFALAHGDSAWACADIDGLVDINCDRKLVIVCFGDSITYGRADTPVEIGYPGRLQNYFPNAIIYNSGVPGENTFSGRARASRELPQIAEIDYLIVLEGVNDYWLSNRSPISTRNNVLDIIQRGANLGAISLLGNLTHILRPNQQWWVSAVNYQVNPYRQIDFYSLGSSIISGDLIHPDASGYDMMAALVVDNLKIYSEANRPIDSDGDGIYDFAEPFFGANPFNPDTDGDGLLDGEEVFVYGSSPLLLDSDSDGLTDPFEVSIGANPADPRPGPPVMEELEVVVSN